MEEHISSEYYRLPEEYHPAANEFLEKTKHEEGEDRERSHSPKLRKMSYLVAAAAAVVTISHAAIPEQPVREQGGSYVDISQYTSWGTANGGVMPVSVGEWQLMDLNGKIVSQKEYNDLECSPNKDGYSVFLLRGNGEDVYCVLNASGEEIFTWERKYVSSTRGCEVCVTDDNIICVAEEYRYIGYWTISGEKIFEEEAEPGENIYGTVFNGGMAVIERNNAHSFQLLLLTPDGKLTELPDVGNEQTMHIFGGIANGYFTVSRAADTYALFDMERKEEVAEIYGRSSVAQITGSENWTCEPGSYCLNNSTLFEESNGTMGAGAQTRYGENRPLEVYNYGTYASIVARSGNGKKSILFDFCDADNSTNILQRAIAVHDEILLDDYKYLCARDGADYFYIDYEGNVVSDNYRFATSFNDARYAMVIEADGNAYLIDENFTKVDRIEDVTAVEPCGETFVCGNDGKEMLYVPAKTK